MYAIVFPNMRLHEHEERLEIFMKKLKNVSWNCELFFISSKNAFEKRRASGGVKIFARIMMFFKGRAAKSLLQQLTMSEL